MKKRFILIAMTGLLYAGAAHSADSMEAPYVTSNNWSGAYLGGTVGYGWLDAEDISFGGGDPDAKGFSGSVFAGYNFQADDWVFGAEADLTFGNVDGSNLNTGGFLAPIEQKIGGTIRARAGYAFGNVLPYFTAGFAIAEFEADHDGAGVNFAKETVSGYVIGAGVDVAFSQNIFGRLEYQYADYGKEDFGFFGGADIHEVDINSHSVRLSVAYKF